MNFNFFSQKDNRIPNLNASIRAQHKHEPAMKAKAVRLNGQITRISGKLKSRPLYWLLTLESCSYACDCVFVNADVLL